MPRRVSISKSFQSSAKTFSRVLGLTVERTVRRSARRSRAHDSWGQWARCFVTNVKFFLSSKLSTEFVRYKNGWTVMQPNIASCWNNQRSFLLMPIRTFLRSEAQARLGQVSRWTNARRKLICPGTEKTNEGIQACCASAQVHAKGR